jgi:hypothetical protein
MKKNSFQKTMSGPVITNPLAIDRINKLFPLLSSLNQRVAVVPPTINIGFTGNFEGSDVLVTVMDTLNMYQFIKIVPQKTNKTPKHTVYVIPKRFCEFYVYNTGNIIPDNIFELWAQDSDYVVDNFYFRDSEGNIVDNVNEYTGTELPQAYHQGTDEPVPENRLSMVRNDTLNDVIAYYVSPQSTEYVHCISNESEKTIEGQELDVDYLNSLMDDPTEDVERIAEYILSTEPGERLYQSIEAELNTNAKPQSVCIKVATFISQYLRPWIFTPTYTSRSL